jgi:hypothetical protein
MPAFVSRKVGARLRPEDGKRSKPQITQIYTDCHTYNSKNQNRLAGFVLLNEFSLWASSSQVTG